MRLFMLLLLLAATIGSCRHKPKRRLSSRNKFTNLFSGGMKPTKSFVLKPRSFGQQEPHLTRLGILPEHRQIEPVPERYETNHQPSRNIPGIPVLPTTGRTSKSEETISNEIGTVIPSEPLKRIRINKPKLLPLPLPSHDQDRLCLPR